MRFVVLGNPESNRVAFFQEALVACSQPKATVVSWLGFLTGAESLDAVLEGEPTILRIESSGKSFEVECELIAQGAAAMDEGRALDPAAARALEFDKGRIRHARQRHLGFLAALDRVQAILDAHPVVRVMNPPQAIALMFDKRLCHAACRSAGVPVPRALEDVRSWDDLRTKQADAKLPRVFVKPAHSSSASGVVALATQGERLAAHTSVELVQEAGEVRLYNSRKIRRYAQESEVATIIDTLCEDGVHVEEWIPKSSLDGLACDVRWVVIGGRAQHVVVRTSKSPMTNLHLKNPRGDLGAFEAMIGDQGLAALRAAAEDATRAVGAPLYAGVDLCVARGLKRHAVLEVNAFGDLLPRVLVDGRDTYTAEVAAVLEAV